MKVHYINILLFAFPLNILVTLCHVHNQRNHNITTLHKKTNRSLCECELYTPANYDNDPQMKRVMQQFEDRTTQRFHEYDNRMVEKRKHCKERCDKEIQKIILKDKLEKELMDKFATLHTDIQNDAIPTCVCEKSIADKVEKGCLKCGGVLGGGVVPSVGLLGGIGEAAMSAWKVAALKTAIASARKAGMAAGEAAGNARGMVIVIKYLKDWGIEEYCSELYEPMLKIKHFTDLKKFSDAIIAKHKAICAATANNDGATCRAFGLRIGTRLKNGSYGTPENQLVPKLLDGLAEQADLAAKAVAKDTAKEVTADLTAEKTGEIAATYGAWKTTIIASIVAIVVIVLIMVIIYLILRHRRKKKMKKKLQYIKLLEE
ncbi:rifin PIR protein, putative [Plasmodium reichenowi]|uniref:Rifin PIR protein, putative n=1 Tax=Plasmodium reichenowi TaxID=5854 RepID=A0A2P9DSL5_PLARE|nr:rifin PIR protein, putative [Plasmodium reichenowi]